jgi:predicted transcriptional regulator of viral defense system
MRNCWRKQIIAFVEEHEKSISIHDLAETLNFSWDDTRSMLEQIYEAGEIGKLPNGRYARKEYAENFRR